MNMVPSDPLEHVYNAEIEMSRPHRQRNVVETEVKGADQTELNRRLQEKGIAPDGAA
jgi:hypothetical protein